MKTYDELYDYIKCGVDEWYELQHINDWNNGVFHTYRNFLGKLEEIREAEEKQTKRGMSVDALLDKIENLERTVSELQSQTSELYLTLCEMELRAKKEG